MPETSTFILFMGAALVLLITPGPAVFYIVARSLERGRPAGIASAAGMAVGSLFHAAFAALGLSAIIMSSVAALSVLKYAGAAYLIYLGVKKLFFGEEAGEPEKGREEKLKGIFGQAVIVNVCNPKTILFFVAFLPQFVDPSKGSLTGQILVLGATLATMGFLSDSLYALAAGGARRFLGNSLLTMPGYISGGAYIGLGILAAFSSVRKK
jgi:threonine/homoserine/homoserine lactone efflux protein